MIAFASSNDPTDLLDWFEDIFRPLKPKLKAKKSVGDYRTFIKHFGEFLIEREEKRGRMRGLAQVSDLTDVNGGGYMLWQAEKGRDPGTINKHRRLFRALAKVALRRRHIAEFPDVEKVSEFEREPDCWSIEEMGLIIEAAGMMPGMVGETPARLWWPAIIWMVFNTGFRISALMAVESKDVDLANGWLIVRAEQQKDRSDQPIDLLPETIAALNAINFKHLKFVFDDWPHDRGGEQWKTLNKHLRRILAKAGLSHGKRDLWHKFRRVFATYIVAASDIETARAKCGHSTSKITWRYVDKKKIKTPMVKDLLPRPQVARQLQLFKPEAS